MIQLKPRTLALIVFTVIGVTMYIHRTQATPTVDRPVLRWIMRAAKSFLWIALVAEGPHDRPTEVGAVSDHMGRDTISHARSF